MAGTTAGEGFLAQYGSMAATSLAGDTLDCKVVCMSSDRCDMNEKPLEVGDSRRSRDLTRIMGGFCGCQRVCRAASMV